MLRSLARMLYARRTGRAPEGDPERMLIVRVDERVGNLISLQSFIDAVRGRWPGCELGLLASERMRLVAESLQGLERLHLLDKRWFFRRPARWRSVLRQIREARYPVAIDASAWHVFSFTHASLTYYSGAPLRIGYRRAGRDAFHSHLVDPGPESEHELAQRMRLLSVLAPGEKLVAPRLRSGLGEQQVARWARWLQQHKVARPRVGIWPGSRKAERRWPPAFFIQLGRQLQQRHGAELVLLWGPGEEGLRDKIGSALHQGVLEAPATDLVELAGLLRNLDLVLTNDTGPMHLAVAVGTPTLAIFASGSASRWGHPYSNVRNLSLPGQDPTEVFEALRAAGSMLAARAGDSAR